MHAHACIPPLVSAPLADRDGAIVGTVEDLMVALTTQEPTWLLVRLHGAAGSARTLVPATGMHAAGPAVRVPYASAQIAAAPAAPTADGRIVREHEVRLCRHYAIRLPPGEASAVHAIAA